MTYQWKIGARAKTDAAVAGEELKRIYRRDGALTPAALLDDSRPEDAPLHSEFEWDDARAAEGYRLAQAGNLIRWLEIVPADAQTGENEEPIRAFAFVTQNDNKVYEPTEVAMRVPNHRAELLAQALKDARSFARKYERLKEFAAVISQIKKLEEGQYNAG